MNLVSYSTLCPMTESFILTLVYCGNNFAKATVPLLTANATIRVLQSKDTLKHFI